MKEKDKGMVSINLKDFTKTINKTIVKRGNKYYQDGYVNHLRQYDRLKYAAMVHGTITYYVDVELNDHNDIIQSSCTCPYQQGEFCKHQVAVFYELLKGKPKEVEKPLKATRQSFIKNSERTVYSDTTKEELTAARNTLLLHIRQGKKQGFIDYYHMPDVLRGFYSIVDQMKRKLTQGDCEGTVQLGLVVLPLIIDVSGYCDDSDGGVSDIVYHALNLIDESTEVGGKTWEPNHKQAIFTSLLTESLQSYYHDRNEWRYQLLKSCVPLCDQPDVRSTLEAYIYQLLKEEQNSKWVDDYAIEELLLILFALIERNEDRETANTFINEHIEYHRFRVLAIERKFLEEDYLSVIRLCREGENLDKAFRFQDHLREILRYRYEASRQLNNPELVRESARDLLLEGNIDYYFILKEMYSAEEWPYILQPIIERLSESHENTAVGILIQEKRTDLLYDYVVHHSSKIVELYPYLLNDYASEVQRIFKEVIRDEAEKANNRKLYKHICNKIKIFIKACGNDSAGKLIEELKETYKRRPALLDELEKIKQ